MDLLFAVGVIWYHPSKEDMDKAFEYSRSFDSVYIYDNTERKTSLKFEELVFPENVFYISRNENLGLPFVYNYFLNKCNRENINFLCILDQDSIFKYEDIQKVKQSLNDNYKEWSESVAIVAPKVDFGDGVAECNEQYTDVEWAISSGSFLNCFLLLKQGIKYDENYFIDRVDADFCHQVRKADKRIVICNNAVLYQQLGERCENKHSNHAPIRHYYIFRDRLYFNNKYLRKIQRISKGLLQSIRHILLILMYEKDKGKKLKACASAFRDYRKGITGKLEER